MRRKGKQPTNTRIDMNIPESTIRVYRDPNPNRPHTFSVELACKAGLTAAIVDQAIADLTVISNQGDDEEHKTVEWDQLFRRCHYFTEDEIRKAVADLQELGLCEVDDE